nr:VIN3-like protein 2 [Ipomoea batatas]
MRFFLSSGFVINPSKYSQLSLEERRQLVHEIVQWSEDAPKVLSSLTRRELLELICAEMGKERKYSGFTKFRMIEHLLKLLSRKSTRSTNTQLDSSPIQSGGGLKRQCIRENLCLPNQCDEEMEDKSEVLCQNLACRAILNAGDAFCRRCSCCICHQYDDNKDPSLWLICYSDYPDEPGSCGLSCHLKCSLSHERSGILLNGPCVKLDGHFYCVSCGKINDLMRTLRKQLVVAKDARRVDVLCLRISLSHKILQYTERYKGLLQVVESAVRALENEVGPLDLASEKMDRSIVNRLSCGAAVQKLCASAVEAFDSLFLDQCFHARKQEPPNCNPMPYEGLGERGNPAVDVAYLRAESMNSSDKQSSSAN